MDDSKMAMPPCEEAAENELVSQNRGVLDAPANLSKREKSRSKSSELVNENFYSADGNNGLIQNQASEKSNAKDEVLDFEDEEERKDGESEVPVQQNWLCFSCDFIVPAGMRKCPACGFIPRRRMVWKVGEDGRHHRVEELYHYSSAEILDALNNNEDGDAWLFTELHRGHFCFDTTLKRWFVFDYDFWEEDILNDAMPGIEDVVALYRSEAIQQVQLRAEAEQSGKTEGAQKYKKREEALLKRVRDLQQLRRKKNILEIAHNGRNRLAIPGDCWDSHPMLFACGNGVINLKTGKLRPGRPEDYIRTVSPIPYPGVDAHAPLWEEFQSGICDGNKELVAFKQRLWGYHLTGKTSENKLVIQNGKGRNGKSVEDEVLYHIFGDYATPVEPETLLHSQKRHAGGVSPDIVALKGKRLVVCSETAKGGKINGARLKQLTGSDKIKGRGLFKDYIDFEPTHKIVLCTNFKPEADANDYAFWQRVMLIDYPLAFVDNPTKSFERKADQKLLEKLKDEAPGILAWLVRGCLAWQKEGLNPPECVRSATAGYRAEEDTIAQFIDEYCIVRKDTRTRVNDLFQKYKEWCSATGNSPETNKDFRAVIEQRFEKQPRTSNGYYYGGIGLLETRLEQR